MTERLRNLARRGDPFVRIEVPRSWVLEITKMLLKQKRKRNATSNSRAMG